MEYASVERPPFSCPRGTIEHKWRITASPIATLADMECLKCGEKRATPAPRYASGKLIPPFYGMGS